MKTMTLGALIVAAAYLLLAIVASFAGTDGANWLWLFRLVRRRINGVEPVPADS
jgi:hypothetical protein